MLVIDDGSTDKTAEIARRCGVDHIVRHTRNQGLARAFMTGLDACLQLGADVIVNTDADNQYNAKDIPTLTAPILEGRADIVVGARPIDSIQHFSPIKKVLQKVGSWVVRFVSRTDIPDAPSGFRAMSRAAALRLMVFNDYTYTLETIIQAGQKNMAIVSVPIRVNEDLRPSRLVKKHTVLCQEEHCHNHSDFRDLQAVPLFRTIGTICHLLLGFLIGLRFLFFYAMGKGEGHVQSLILAALLMGMGFQTILIAFVADLQAANRKMLEDLRYSIRRHNYGGSFSSQERIKKDG